MLGMEIQEKVRNAQCGRTIAVDNAHTLVQR